MRLMTGSMKRLWVRLSLAFLVVAWLAVGAVAISVNVSTERSFRHYLNQRDSGLFSDQALDNLQNYYAEQGTWAGVDSLLPGPRSGAGNTDHEGGGGKGQGQGRGGAIVLLADVDGIVVASTDPARVGSSLDNDMLDRAAELRVDGVQVGWLAQETPGEQALGQAEEQFLEETTRWLVLAAIGASLLAVVVGGMLSWGLARPIRALTGAAHDLAGGDLGRQVMVGDTAAELTELAEAFNSMSRDLAEGETLRRRMAADIAHELRTPVSVLRGHLEAMLDGVFPLDAEHLAVAYDRTIHLSRLVDDLRLLTRAEAGQLPLEHVPTSPGNLVTLAAESFAPLALDAGITLRQNIADDLPRVVVDVDRLQQVLGNLLTNALRHTSSGGEIAIQVRRAGQTVRFSVTNTGPELSPEQAAQVFTPFWRAEDARSRDQGGSGLGLAITRQLLRLHGGRIWVENAPGRTAFVFDLPGDEG